MAKKGGNKKACEKYRTSGHKVENKRNRQKRHEKRLAKFKRRKEDGKKYKYTPIPFKKGTDDYAIEKSDRHEKYINSVTKTEFQKFKSTMRKLNNWLKEDEKRRKELKDKKKKHINNKKKQVIRKGEK